MEIKVELDDFSTLEGPEPGAKQSQWNPNEWYGPRWIVSIPDGWEYEHSGQGVLWRAIGRFRTEAEARAFAETRKA